MMSLAFHYSPLSQEKNFEVNKTVCLSALEKIKQGGFSSCSEIDDIDMHIQNLRNEIKSGEFALL